jgi:hypothetical protein
MPEQNMQFPIPNSVLEPYIKTAVATAITASLGDGSKLVELAVQQALGVMVASDGAISRYSSDNKYQLVEVLAINKIRELTRETINEMAEQMRPKIKEQIEKQLRTKHSLLAQALVDGLIGSLKTTWSVKVDINTTDK